MFTVVVFRSVVGVVATSNDDGLKWVDEVMIQDDGGMMIEADDNDNDGDPFAVTVGDDDASEGVEEVEGHTISSMESGERVLSSLE